MPELQVVERNEECSFIGLPGENLFDVMVGEEPSPLMPPTLPPTHTHNMWAKWGLLRLQVHCE